VSRRLPHAAAVATILRAGAVICLLQVPLAAFGEEHGRVKWKPPTPEQAARRASGEAMNDSILRRGDVVATDRGFLLYRGYAEDGSRDFVAVQNPLMPAKR
jgi:hypothetical protein